MYVARVPNRGSPPAVLLRESYREQGKVKNRTLANLSHWPAEKVAALEAVLKGLPPAVGLERALEVSRSLPHGHVAAVLGTLRRLGLEELVGPPCRERDLVVAMACAGVISPSSKLACARGLCPATAATSLGEVCSVSWADEDDLYGAMDWLLERQGQIEQALAARHLRDGVLVLYDVSSAAFEGHTCPLGKRGYPRDGVHGRLQIVYGLLTTTEGVPVAVEVFEGNTGDPKTVASQVEKLKGRFRLSHVCLVGDRGMLTGARLRQDVAPAQLDWVSSLRSPQIKALIDDGTIQLGLFDQADLFEVSHPDYPGERLVACRNPLLAEERARKREDLLAATEADLAPIKASVERDKRPLRGKDKIALKVGRVINRHKVAKHFVTEVGEACFSFSRNEQRIAEEASLDGIYVIRTSLSQDVLGRDGVVFSYKELENVERAFRGFNSELDVRPIHHHLAGRVRSHVFLRMLSYYVAWHMKHALAPLLFKDHDKAAALAGRQSPVAPAVRSPKALEKIARKHSDDGAPVHSFQTLLQDLGTVCVNTLQPIDPAILPFQKVSLPTPLQRRAFDLLGVSYHLGYAA
ncbi:MAG TPA: IS1634 family transposase [Acidimicrobiales bacterium]|nr:IS1634 family transposase [Acidimicrobiales bacterium]